MTVLDDRSQALATAARTALGDEPAAILMEMLMPTGEPPATGSDVRATRADVVSLRSEVNTRFEQVDARFEQVDARFNEVDAQFVELHHRLDVMHHELVGIFRGELNEATRGQARALFLGVVTSVVSIGALSFTFAQLIA